MGYITCNYLAAAQQSELELDIQDAYRVNGRLEAQLEALAEAEATQVCMRAQRACVRVLAVGVV